MRSHKAELLTLPHGRCKEGTVEGVTAGLLHVSPLNFSNHIDVPHCYHPACMLTARLSTYWQEKGRTQTHAEGKGRWGDAVTVTCIA